MTATIPTTEPTTIVAGDTAKWLKTYAAYPPSEGWALSYTLINSANRYIFAATVQEDSFLVTLAATVTSAWAAGAYAWRSRASKAGEIYTLGGGSIVVQASFASVVDTRSNSKTMLDSVNAVLLKTASENVLEYEIAGRRLKHYDIPGLLALRDRLTAEVARETAAANIANGLGNPGRIYVRF